MKYYLDTEFNGFRGEIISLALIAENGESLYLMNIERGIPLKWVRDNVEPHFFNCPVDPFECSLPMWPMCIYDFIKETYDGQQTHIIADWPDDFKYFCEALITGPGKMIIIPGLVMEVVRVDSYPTNLEGAIQHNAWWDAMALKEKLKE